jgi:hypothetical protein
MGKWREVEKCLGDLSRKCGFVKEGGRVNRPGFASGAIRIPGEVSKDCAISGNPWKEREMTRACQFSHAGLDQGGVGYLKGQSSGCSLQGVQDQVMPCGSAGRAV